MAGILTLPPELQCMVLAYCEHRSLTALSRVSKHARSLTTPFLYANIHWQFATGCTSPLRLLLRSLLERPELALLIKHLKLDVDESYKDFNEFDYAADHMSDINSVEFEPEEINLAMEFLSTKAMPEQDRWKIALDEGSIDASLALLLCHLESIQTVQLGLWLLHNSFFISDMLKHIIKPDNPYFKHLRHAKFGENMEPYLAADLNNHPCLIYPLFGLPCLETMDVALNLEPSDFLTEQPFKSQSLKELRLWNCGLEPEAVEQVLEGTPALKTLRCELSRDWTIYDFPEDKVDLAVLHNAFTHVSGTLESLEVDITVWEKKFDTVTLEYRKIALLPMGSFQNFHSLKHLRLPAEFLLGKLPWHAERLREALPSTLQSLSLINSIGSSRFRPGFSPPPKHEDHPKRWLRPLIRVLVKYLTDYPNHTPNLTRLTMQNLGWPATAGVDVFTDEYARLKQIASQHGIEVRDSGYR